MKLQTLTKEEIELVKAVMNVVGFIYPAQDKAIETIWNKLDDYGIDDKYPDLEDIVDNFSEALNAKADIKKHLKKLIKAL